MDPPRERCALPFQSGRLTGGRRSGIASTRRQSPPLVESGSATTLRLDIGCICAYVSAYTLNAKGEELFMSTDSRPRVEECTCLAVRQAARRITQFYDQHLAPFWLRITQFSILAKLKQLGPMTSNALADELAMDRTTLGRNILPLKRQRLIGLAP